MTNKCIKCGCDNPYLSQPPSPTPAIPPDQSGLQLTAGARHMSAQLASRAHGIEAAALMAKEGTGVVYECGIKIFEEQLR